MSAASASSALLDALLEFLAAATHTLLKCRAVYSAALFENRRLFGVAVSQCRHPGVCAYVGGVLRELRPLLERDGLQELVVAFYDPCGALHSKASFVIHGLAPAAAGAAPDWPALEAAFRSTLLKLHFSDNLVAPLPPGSTFELLAVATTRDGVSLAAFTEEAGVRAISLRQPASGVPVHTCLLPGVLSMQVLLEEGAAAPSQEPGSAAAAAGTQATGAAAPSQPTQQSQPAAGQQ